MESNYGIGVYGGPVAVAQSVEGGLGLKPTHALESPVSRELNALAKNTAELDQVMASLEQRLAPVTIPMPQADPRVEGGNKESSAGILADALRASNQRLESLRRRITNARDTLAV